MNSWSNRILCRRADHRGCDSRAFDGGSAKNDIDEKKIIKHASPTCLTTASKSQRYETDDWKEIRFANAVKNFVATSEFVELKVNEKLVHLDKSKDS